MRSCLRRLSLAALCIVIGLAVFASSALGAGVEPLFRLYATAAIEGNEHPLSRPPPGTGFDGPCGLAVDTEAEFYVSDYSHHAVDVFKPNLDLQVQLAGEDPQDGPCGLGVDPSGDLYVNNFHRNVLKYHATLPLSGPKPYGPAVVIDSAHPTGVAVDPGSGDVYVNDRTYIAVYDSSGAPVEVGGEPLRIGEGSLGDGYGVAVSGYPATAGYVYVPDATDDTVKVYDPSIDADEPIATIDGQATPYVSFISLRDSAVAVDSSSGVVYVVDNLQPEYYERPEAAVYAFGPDGIYRGRLKYNIVDALPPGLAVDNSGKASQGRVYVTSGNSTYSSVYAYEPGGLTKFEFPAQPPAPPIDVGPEETLGSFGDPLLALAPSTSEGSAAVPQRSVRKRHRHRRQHRVRRAQPIHGRGR